MRLKMVVGGKLSNECVSGEFSILATCAGHSHDSRFVNIRFKAHALLLVALVTPKEKGCDI